MAVPVRPASENGMAMRPTLVEPPEASPGAAITSAEARSFTYPSRVVADSEGHLHPGTEHDEVMTVLRIATHDGSEGYCFGINPAILDVVRPLLLGRDALDRELIWRDLRRIGRIRRDFSDADLGAIDQALWDLAGRRFGQPIRKLLGSFRNQVLAYASTMCGDDLDGGLSSPAAYGAFAAECQRAGYTGFKLHTWMPPFRPDVRLDVAACQAVREAVGPSMNLMLDPHHDYSREEALYLGRALEELDFHWLEEPMDEHSVSSYVWLTDQLDLSVIGPESSEGRMQTRAEWIVRGASDISRIDVWHGGITGAIKAVHLCEAFGLRLEIHYTGAGNLQVLGAMSIPGEYYERGLLHPALSYDDRTPWLRSLVDPMGGDGLVTISDRPGLGEDIDWAFIEANAAGAWS